MPTYQYKCTECEQLLEVQQSFSEPALETLPGCEINAKQTHQLKKVFSAVSIAFKGDGFYKNDARSKSSSSTKSESASTKTEATKSESTSKPEKSSTKKAEAKPSK